MRRSIGRPLPLRIFLALSLACTCVAGRASAQLSAPAQQRQMPNVVGLTSDQAAGRLRQLGLSVQTRDVPSTQARGTVTAQSPAAGAGVKPGQAATLDVSTGQGREQTQTGGGATDGGGRTAGGVDVQVRPPRPGQVPDLTGMSRTSARLRLVLSGLVLGEVDSAWVEGARGGRVVAQDPQAGTQVLPGRRVRVTLASRTPPNPQPNPQPDTQPQQPTVDLVTVPNLSGMTPERARAAVGRARLLLGGVDSARAGSAAPGTVSAQRPAPGEQVRPGSFVSITVAQSPRVAMPSLVGRPVAEARRTLAAAGLRAGGVTEREARGAAGRVLTQSIPPGTQVRPATAVDLAISRVPVAQQVDTARRDTVRRDTVRRDTVRRDTARRDTARRDTARERPRRDTLVLSTPAQQGTPGTTLPGQTVPVRRPVSQPETPGWQGVPREVLWGALALLVLAAGAILYRLTRRGGRPPVQATQATPVAPAPVSCAVRLSVAGGEWESTSQTEAAGPALGGKLRLDVRIAEPQPIAQAVGALPEPALGSTRVAVRVVDDAVGMMEVMDEAGPVLVGAAMQVRVREGAPTFTADEDTPIILGRRR